jgi:cellobiose phosphorylase
MKIGAELADLIGEKDKAAELRRNADVMARRINKVGWDGEWYLRGFTDDGEPFGSSRNEEGKIYLNPQSWSILSGVVTEERLPKVLRSVDRLLEGENGLALLAPAYTKTDVRIGRITAFARGTKENAAVFCHANLFMIAADCMAGRGDVAYRRLCRILPCRQDQERYKAEPYVFAEYLIGPEHPYEAGRGAYTWVTGSAGWSLMVMTEHMLGVKPDYSGLRIDPCIPSHWKRCSIVRPFRGATYEIVVENPEGVQRGVEEITVDGRKIDGNLISPFSDGKVHRVRVVLG